MKTHLSRLPHSRTILYGNVYILSTCVFSAAFTSLTALWILQEKSLSMPTCTSGWQKPTHYSGVHISSAVPVSSDLRLATVSVHRDKNSSHSSSIQNIHSLSRSMCVESTSTRSIQKINNLSLSMRYVGESEQHACLYTRCRKTYAFTNMAVRERYIRGDTHTHTSTSAH